MLIRHLSYFVVLARERHYARAAEACNIAQPTLSAAIRKLEEDLQVHLVVRGHRFLGLTPDGERVLEWGRRILADYSSLRHGLGGSPTDLTGKLRLGVIPAAMPAAPLLTGPFLRAHPAASVEILSMTSRAIANGLETFEIDAGLTYLDNEPLKQVARHPLYRERYLFITKQGGPDADRATISWADAVRTPLCLLHEDMQNRRIINRIAASAGVELDAAIVSNSFLSVCAHLVAGGWSSIMPHTFLNVFGPPTGLVGIPLVDPVETQSIGLVLPDHDPLSPIADALRALLTNLDFEADLARLGRV